MDEFAKNQINAIEKHIADIGNCLSRLLKTATPRQKVYIGDVLEELNRFEMVDVFDLRKSFENE